MKIVQDSYYTVDSDSGSVIEAYVAIETDSKGKTQNHRVISVDGTCFFLTAKECRGLTLILAKELFAFDHAIKPETEVLIDEHSLPRAKRCDSTH